MSNLAICRRYAAALHAEASSSGTIARVDQDVAMAQASLVGSRELRLFFASPVISTTTRRTGIEKLFGDRVSEVFLRFLLLVNEKGRGEMVADMLDAYRALRNRLLGIVEAEARVAMTLSEEDSEALRKRLSAQEGAEIQLHVAQDASLLGGVVVRIGDTVYDGSLKNSLTALRVRLEARSMLKN